MGRILVGVDGSEPSKDALLWAADQARGTESVLHVVSVGDHSLPPTSAEPQPETPDRLENQRQRLGNLVTDVLGASPEIEVRVDVVKSHPGPALVDLAQGADLLVVGSRGHGTIAGILLGSVSLHCAARSPCPVVVHRRRSGEGSSPVDRSSTTNRIVVAVDGSASSNGAALWAAHQGELKASVLEMVTAWHWGAFSEWAPASPEDEYDPEEGAQGVLEETARIVRAACPTVEVLSRIINGPPGGAVVEASREADLLVVGSSRHGEVAGMLLGSVSEHCATHAHCPVLVYRG